ncbi:MAG: hypothetical protein M1820_004264 [Bogoriella megaspora]|nr:MAG: hypothetical protein M1820_004264 [Bogoriella megaspora]
MMDPRYRWEEITYDNIQPLIAEYPNYVPESLQALEEARWNTIPETLSQRKKTGKAYLELDEVVQLVEWKLKHGTFRPTLLSLIKSNPPSTIHSTTTLAFQTPTEVSSALTHLTSLRGIGPATASLLLSCYNPTSVPFFSDELYRWLHYEDDDDDDDGGGEKGKGKGKGKGWERKMKYTVKEYESLYERAREVVGRIGKVEGREVGMGELEKGAWVLGRRRGVVVGGKGGDVGSKVETGGEERGMGKAGKEREVKGAVRERKRKVEGEDTGGRRSLRRRKG